jgi:hypothetical protein
VTALADLNPRILPPGEQGTQFLAFLCPRCRRHEIAVELWGGPAGEIDRSIGEHTFKVRVWHATQGQHRDWATLSLTPSINRDSTGDTCGGWHGFITNGEATP